MGERTGVVVNPTKFVDVAALRRETETCAARSGYGDVRWYETTRSDAGELVTKQAIAEGCDLLVICGGDGTVTACASGLLDSRAEVRMAVIAAGTGNLFARNLGLPLELTDALAVAFGTTVRSVDVLQTNDRRFLVMAGLGIDAALIRDTSDTLKERIGWPAYVTGLIKSVKATSPMGMSIEVDGQPAALNLRGVGVIVGNVGGLQAGIKLLVAATPDDGLLDVIVLTPASGSHWARLVARILTRQADKSPTTFTAQGRHVSIRTDRPAPIEFDGEYVGQSDRLDVSVLAGALTLCCPVDDAAS